MSSSTAAATTKKSYLLLLECLGKKVLEPTIKRPGEKPVPIEVEVQLLPGSLMREVRHEASQVYLRSLDHDNVYAVCPLGNVQELDAGEADVLLPITNLRERLKAYADLGCLEDLLNEGSPVVVYAGGEARDGILRYWGQVPEMGRGIWFGVELLKGMDKGCCDGSVKGKRYFQCQDNRGIFVSLSHLEPSYPRESAGSIKLGLAPSRPTASIHTLKKSGGSDRGRAPAPISLETAVASGSPPPPLSLGDRVVWISDTGPEFGVVRWLGKLPDVGNDWMVGLEFDHPVGTGTGKYNDHQLFEAKLHHASLVPLIGLLKAEDFVDDRVPAKPLRAKKQDSALAAAGASDKPKVSERVVENGVRSSPAGNRRPTASANLQVSLPVNPLYEYEMLAEKVADKGGAPIKAPTSAVESGPKTTLETSGDLEVGSVVEVTINQTPCYGVIRWIGDPGGDGRKVLAGIELEEEHPGCTDGTMNGKRYFTCPPHKAYFVRLSQCHKDSRFQELPPPPSHHHHPSSTSSHKTQTAATMSEMLGENGSALFGSIDCPTVSGDVAPLASLEQLYGKNKGIQGHHNSCYLDATLFSMFSCTSVFDSLLYRPPGPTDIPEYLQVQRVLKEEIVNPLRANCYVRADRVMKLRTLLDRLSSVSGLTSEEKDPEEFLNCLLNQIMKAEPFLKLSSGQESFFYQLFLEKDERLTLPTVQHLFDQSFLMSEIKLQQVPACLLIQMPRFGRQFKMYPRIQPSQYLDITDVLENSPRQCSICGQLAEFECKECFGQFGEGLDSIAFCPKCMEKSHSHKKRARHHSTRLKVPSEFQMLKDHSPIPRIYMELFAVVCIETSHYVSFVKCGSGPEAPWCFFDSMADRKGEVNGYNIPEVVQFPDLQWWLSEEGAAFLLSTKDDKSLPSNVRRLICDAYMCMYQSPEVMMYR